LIDPLAFRKMPLAIFLTRHRWFGSACSAIQYICGSSHFSIDTRRT
jgi:hypothetical protein